MRAEGTAVLIESTRDVAEVDGLLLPKATATLTKTRHSAFIRTDLEDTLHRLNIDHLVLTGAFIDGCVGLTAIDAYERDFRVCIAREAVVAVNETQSECMLRFLGEEFGVPAISNAEIVTGLTPAAQQASRSDN